jgi:hypothetical protein
MSNELTPDFDAMDIGKLRQYASHLRLAIPRTATKQDIIDSINAKLRDRSTPEIAEAGSRPRPGYARIKLLVDPMPGASNMPVYVNANGYVCTIPRDVVVDVPMRVVRTLNDATVLRKKQSTNMQPDGREKFETTESNVPSYPFQVLDMVPGPEVLTSFEERKLKSIGPRRRYRDMFGRWPKPRDLQRAIEQGLVSLKEDEELDEVTANLAPADMLG